MFDLQNPHTVAYYAAQYEALAADADYVTAFQAFRDSGQHYGSAEDYALWSAASYANATERLIRRRRVWEA